MKDLIENLLGFIYSLSMGDYFFFIGTFLLIVLFIYIVYLIKCGDEETTLEDDLLNINYDNNKNDGFDLESVARDIEKNYKPEAIKLTSYEEEQENNAIISYEELVKNKDKFQFTYDDEYEYEIPELKVKKFDLSNTSEITIPENKLEVKLMNYDKEEEFLRALKELQNNLSHQ